MYINNRMELAAKSMPVLNLVMPLVTTPMANLSLIRRRHVIKPDKATIVHVE